MLRQLRRQPAALGGEDGGITGRSRCRLGGGTELALSRAGSINMRIAVLGGGSWGTSLARVFVDRGHLCALWVRNPEVAATIRVGAAEPAPPARRPAAHAADHHRLAGCGPAGGRAGRAGRPLRRPAHAAGGSAAAAGGGGDDTGWHPGPGVDRSRHAPPSWRPRCCRRRPAMDCWPWAARCSLSEVARGLPSTLVLAGPEGPAANRCAPL